MGRKRSLTNAQVLDAINRWLLEHGFPPTVEELRSRLGVASKQTVARYLEWLEESGEIERWPGARGLRLLRQPKKGVCTRPVAVVGEAPAGSLMIAEENQQGWVRLPESFLQPNTGRYFLVRVRGDSMNKARVEGGRIENGDLIVVRQQATAEPRSIVVALIDGEATIKRFTRGSGYYLLKPESTNQHHQPIIVDQDFRVQGVVCRVIKAGADIISTDN